MARARQRGRGPGAAGHLGPWRTWYRREVSPLPGGDDAWVGERLEYQFRIGAGARAFDAPAHGGGDVDWHSFDASDRPLPAPDGPPPDDPPPAAAPEVHALLASPLRYPGMPSDRLLKSAGVQVLEDAEIPCEGIVVRRLPSMTRRSDGTYERWTTRRVGVGRGEGASRIAFDASTSRAPRPNDR